MRGANRFACVAALLLCSCATSSHLSIRSVGATPVSPSVADAEAQLALGNVALALEGFRKAAREAPQDTEAMAGIAECYDRMGQFDLSRKWYETALAIAPEDSKLLAKLADSLDMQGRSSEAAAVRSEAAGFTHPLSVAVAANAVQLNGNTVYLSKPGGQVTVALPPIVPASEAAAAAPVLPQQIRPEAVNGPHLERLSLGVVALVTTAQPVWKAQLVDRTPQSVTFRFVSDDPQMRLLNAARYEGLAARTRDALLKHGWTGIAIGNAPAVRERTVVLYPVSQRARAERIAAALGVGTIQASIAGQVTVLLGLDATRADARRQAA